MFTPEEAIQEIKKYYDNQDLVSNWFDVNQDAVNQFGESTGDTDWLHTDPERAKKESPFGGTIAFGFWTLSTLTALSRQMSGQPYPEHVKYGLNYGFDRIRFISPVPVGSRIRCKAKLMNIEDRGNQHYLIKTENIIEVEGTDKPAMLAEWLFMLVYPTE